MTNVLCQLNHCKIHTTKLHPNVSGVSVYTAKNATDLLQVVNFTGLLRLVNNLQQACQLYQFAKKVCEDQACCNLSFADFLQLVVVKITYTAKNAQVATILLTSCNNLLQQADIRMRSQGLRQTCCKLMIKQACCKSFQQVGTSLQMTS